MNQSITRQILASAALLAITCLGASNASAETEPNNTSTNANTITMTFANGGTMSGKLRTGGMTPNPLDVDFFKFTNVHAYSSITVKIIPSGISPVEHFSYEVLTTALTPITPFPDIPQVSGAPSTFAITSPNPGVSFFIRVFDDGLTMASGDGDYTIEVTGTGGVNPAVAYAALLKKCKALEAAYLKAKAKAKKTGVPADRRKALGLSKQVALCKRALAALKAKAGL